MSVLPHYSSTLKTYSSRQAVANHRCSCHISIPTIIRCSAIAPPKPKLNGNQPTVETPLPSISPAVSAPRPDDRTLQSTWVHRAWITAGGATLSLTLAKSLATASSLHVWLEPALASLLGYVLADLGSGVYHWGIDNYGDATTPIFGGQIDAFQGHHRWPWTITKRQFANNLHALAQAITFSVLPIDLAGNDPTFLAFVGVFSGCIMFSQQFHAWAHGTKSKLPQLVVALQDLGVLISRSQHSAHHRPPYNNNYCIVSGLWNEFLDKNKVFEAMEMAIFFRFGVRPRSWSEPSLEWAEQEVAAPSSALISVQ